MHLPPWIWVVCHLGSLCRPLLLNSLPRPRVPRRGLLLVPPASPEPGRCVTSCRCRSDASRDESSSPRSRRSRCSRSLWGAHCPLHGLLLRSPRHWW